MSQNRRNLDNSAEQIADGGNAPIRRVLSVERPEMARQRTFMRLLLMLIVIAATVAGWNIAHRIERQQVFQALEGMQQTLEVRWAEMNLRALQPARSICDEIDSGAIKNEKDFEKRGQELRQSNELYEALFWMSADGSCKASVASEALGPVNSLPFGADASFWSQLRRKSVGKQPIAGPIYEGSFGRTLALLYFPLDDAGKTGGEAVAVVLRVSRLMEHFTEGDLRDLVSLDLVRSGQLVYRTGAYISERDPEYRRVAHLRMLDQQWMCYMMPTSRLVKEYDSAMAWVVLVFGIMGSVVAGISALDSMKRRWQHMILEKGHVQVIDVISDLSRVTAKEGGKGQDQLHRLVEVARPVVQCDKVALYQLTQNNRQLNLVSHSGEVVIRSQVEFVDGLHPVLEGRMLSLGFVRNEPKGLLNHFAPDGIRSAVIAPVLLEKTTGIMFWGSNDTEPWTEGRYALARLWATQAAVMMTDEAIHRQMRDALWVQEKLARRRELMLTVLGEVYQAGTMEQTLGRIAQLSPRALGVEACLVALRTRREGELEIVAATDELDRRLGGVHLQVPVNYLAKLAKPGSVSVINREEMGPAGFAFLFQPWLTAMAITPMLYNDGRPIGCLLLLSGGAGIFTEDQMDLARVLASRASAAFENAQLNQQIRRDADTRAMLLRELNHRVKNNLAGIVGLLSTNTMEMPADVRQWLDRVIERIGNIARAHELLAGGLQTIGLAKLIEQVIPSLAVVKPAGVEIKQDLGTTEIWLRTTQAVSLAMVIHELCYNAIVHGLSSQGVLTIRARIVDGQRAVLDVIDDGTAAAARAAGIATAPPPASTGLGLKLVKGLVGRELRGSFSMRQQDNAGTIVSVEFPLEIDREEGVDGR